MLGVVQKHHIVNPQIAVVQDVESAQFSSLGSESSFKGFVSKRVELVAILFEAWQYFLFYTHILDHVFLEKFSAH